VAVAAMKLNLNGWRTILWEFRCYQPFVALVHKAAALTIAVARRTC
jgi:hypothetical protein